jgi:hypothetical protein
MIALYTHLTFGDGFIVSNIKQLPGVHPIRRLLGQAEFGVLQLNEGGLFVLLSVHGDFDRVFNFHHDVIYLNPIITHSLTHSIVICDRV